MIINQLTRGNLHPLLRDVRAVLFDAGGTLVHPDWERISVLALRETGRAFPAGEMHRSLNESLRRVDKQISDGTVKATHTQRPGWMFGELFSMLGIEESICDRIRAQVVSSHGQKHIWCSLDPQVPRLIDELKRAGLSVGVISNTEDGRLEEVLTLAGVAALFDILVDSYVIGLRKPDPAIFHYALQQLKVEPHEAVYVGDSYGHDVLGAQGAGVRAILLDPLNIHPGADCARIHELSELTGDVGC